MIAITITVGNKGQLMSVTASGHAETADFGKDTVCAAVSFLLRTVAITLGDRCSVAAKERGKFDLQVRSDAVPISDLQFLAKLLENGFQSLQAEFPQAVRMTIRQLLE